jgi:hypothetical protein
MKGDLFYKEKHLCEVYEVRKDFIYVGEAKDHEALGGETFLHDPSFNRFTFQAPFDIPLPFGEQVILRMNERSFPIAIKDVTLKTETVIVVAYGSSSL